MLVTVDGSRPIETVYYDVQDKLGLLERKRAPEPEVAA
jgi:hypothetical protein